MRILYHTSTVFLAVFFLASSTQCHQIHDIENESTTQVPPTKVPAFHAEPHAAHPDHHHQQAPVPAPNANAGHPGHSGHDQMISNMNKEHVLDHLDGVINKPKEQMTVEEQNFYYFKLHDYDNNNMLDGIELVSAFAHHDEHDDHHHHDQNHTNSTASAEKHSRISDEDLMNLVDSILTDEDSNHDGYITYHEFLHAIKGSA